MAACVGRCLFVYGGTEAQPFVAEWYDPRAGTWTQVAPNDVDAGDRIDAAAAAVGQHVYVIGGVRHMGAGPKGFLGSTTMYVLVFARVLCNFADCTCVQIRCRKRSMAAWPVAAVRTVAACCGRDRRLHLRRGWL